MVTVGRYESMVEVVVLPIHIIDILMHVSVTPRCYIRHITFSTTLLRVSDSVERHLCVHAACLSVERHLCVHAACLSVERHLCVHAACLSVKRHLCACHNVRCRATLACLSELCMLLRGVRL